MNGKVATISDFLFEKDKIDFVISNKKTFYKTGRQ